MLIVWNEMLQENIENQMEAKDYEWRSVQQSAMQVEHGATGDVKEAKPVWTHMKDDGQ